MEALPLLLIITICLELTLMRARYKWFASRGVVDVLATTLSTFAICLSAGHMSIASIPLLLRLGVFRFALILLCWFILVSELTAGALTKINNEYGVCRGV